MKPERRNRQHEKTPQAPALGRALLFHLFYFCGAALLATVLTILLGWGWGVIVMVLLWPTMFAWFPALWERLFRSEQEIHWLASLLVLFSIFGASINVPSLQALLTQAEVPVIAASRIGDFPGVPAFRFSDAEVRTQYAHLRTARVYDARRSTTTISHVTVAPLTDASWNKNDPVAAWVVCYGFEAAAKRCPHWQSRNASAINDVEWRDSAMATHAVRDAAAKYGLVLAPDVRLLEWVPSIEAAIRSRIAAYLAAIFVVYWVWAAIFGLSCWRHARRQGN